jgi:hypothetical protein
MDKVWTGPHRFTQHKPSLEILAVHMSSSLAQPTRISEFRIHLPSLGRTLTFVCSIFYVVGVFGTGFIPVINYLLFRWQVCIDFHFEIIGEGWDQARDLLNTILAHLSPDKHIDNHQKMGLEPTFETPIYVYQYWPTSDNEQNLTQYWYNNQIISCIQITWQNAVYMETYS